MTGKYKGNPFQLKDDYAINNITFLSNLAEWQKPSTTRKMVFSIEIIKA